MITTTALLKKLRGKGDGLAKHVSRPKPYWASVGHPQRKVEERKVSNIHQLRDVIMEEWKRTSSGNLWSSGELHAQEG